MPLTEISPNIRHHGSHSQSSQSPRKGLSSIKPATSLAPNAVQSMLRTTTETGDIGQFSVRPSRLPRSGSRILATRRRSGSFDSSVPPVLPRQRPRPLRGKAQINNGARQMPSFSSLSRQDTIRSSLTSYRNNLRARPRHARPYPYGIESMTCPPVGPHSLYSHRSLVTLRSQRDISSMSSNSPVGQARRLRRPGYRATSPAYSDALSHGYSLHPHYYRSASVGTAASSPVSAFPRPVGMPGYIPYMNGSLASFVRLPSPVVRPPYYGLRPSPFPSRTNTPVSVSIRELQRSPTGSTIPQYYDYTESFAEEDCFSSDIDASATSLPFNMDQTILETEAASLTRRAQTPFGTMPGSAFYPAELPTKHNRTISEQSKSSSIASVPNRKSSRAFSKRSRTPKETDQQHNIRRLTQELKESHTRPQSATVRGPPKEDEPRRSSIASRRTCSSSPSSSFFPNASRSARDLARLAARVHSPVQSDNTQHILGLDSLLSGSDEGAESAESKRPDWQLPSLNFRPLSFAHYVQGSTDRPKSAEGVKTNSIIEIISPTPERPISSQSRRRFSKILGIEDDHHSIASSISRSYSSLNFARLKRVVELPESTYPVRFSIPPYSPRRSTIDEGTEEGDGDVGGRQNTNSSQATSNAKSTVESLLDKHIQCLGLQPELSEVDPDVKICQEQKCGSLTASGTESTVKVSDHDKQLWHEKTRPRSASSAYPSTFPSPERELLIPMKLFSNKFYSTALPSSSRLTSAQSLPCMSEAMSPVRTANRLSPGWQTLASTTQLLSSPLTLPDLETNLGKNLHQSPDSRKYKVRRRSEIILSPSAPRCQSQRLEDTYDWDNDSALQEKWRDRYLARQASDRRKVRVRLKLKRSSVSQDELGKTEISNTQAILHAAPSNVDVDEPVLEQHLRDVKQPAELPAHEKGAQVLATADETSDYGTAPAHALKTTGSPDIPHRWSSIVAIAPEVVQPMMGVGRLASTRTARSLRSHASLAEPINSTRLSVQIPRLSNQAPRLIAPDLAPSLSSLNLDMSVRYPNIISNPRPVLRETRSFFSDDSSAIQKQRGSLRNRFHLHSLRSVLPSSPRGTMVNDGPVRTPRSNVIKAHQVRGQSGEEEERDLYGTVGMTDFAYRKRKMIERLKDWWKRHSMQRKLGLKRKKSSKNIANKEAENGIREVMV